MTGKERVLVSHMLTELEAPARELSNWEEAFISSLTESINGEFDLSDRQMEILKKIYTDKGEFNRR